MEEAIQGLRDMFNLQQIEIGKVRDKVHDMVTEVTTIKLSIVKITDKMETRSPCDLHVNSMKELNDGINRIELLSSTTASKFDGFISLANTLIGDVYKKDGLMTTAQSNKNQIGLIWGIVVAIFIAGGILFVWRN